MRSLTSLVSGELTPFPSWRNGERRYEVGGLVDAAVLAGNRLDTERPAGASLRRSRVTRSVLEGIRRGDCLEGAQGRSFSREGVRAVKIGRHADAAISQAVTSGEQYGENTLVSRLSRLLAPC